jgi:signal transduction histidine kinase
MRVRPRRRKSTAFFIVLGSCLVALAIALNVGWIILNWREVAVLVFGIIFFLLIIFGLVLNTLFLIHELKTPIASIRLYLETLKTRDVDEVQREAFYNIMLADSDRLLQTVNQVLRAGRSGHRRRRIATSVINVGDTVRECLELTKVRYGLGDGNLIYSETLDVTEAKVSGDIEELKAAFSNLLDNAVKYSDKEIRVTVSVSAIDSKRVAVRVADRGIGIPSAQLRRIFKRFYRVPGMFMSRVKGTGLGLFIVRSVVEKHGGRVYAESQGLGHGSTFTIQLPRVS